MNTNLRAILFGAAVASVLTFTLDNVFAAEHRQVVRSEAAEVADHRANPDADGAVRPILLDPVVVTAHRSAVE